MMMKEGFIEEPPADDTQIEITTEEANAAY
jgi:hypothetical protein